MSFNSMLLLRELVFLVRCISVEIKKFGKEADSVAAVLMPWECSLT